METRANYILIGAFTLAGILGALGFFIWLANLQLDRQYAYYDILFDNVSGLGVAGNVSFNGVSVGQVTSIDLYPKDPSKVIVRVQVDAETPIKADTSAQLKSQGVTGTSFIEMTGGGASAPRLRDVSTNGVPVITADRSVVQALTEDAPDLLTEAITLMRNLQEFVGPGNQNYVAGILGNLDKASSQLSTALNDFSSVSKSFSEASGQITGFTSRLDAIGAAVETTLEKTNGALDVAKGALAQAQATLSTGTITLLKAGTTFDSANGVIKDQIPGIVADLGQTVDALNTGIADLKTQGQTVIASFGSTSELAGQRMIQLRGTIAALETTLATTQTTLDAVTTSAASFETLIDGEGTALVADARATLAQADVSIAAINKVVAEDVPVIVADVRTAVDTANRVIDQVGGDVTGLTGRFEPLAASAGVTLAAATKTFGDASRTLIRLETAMDTVESTLTAAETTFTTANRIIDQEVAPTAADIRNSARNLDAAIADVSADLPAITAEIKATLQRANQVVAQVDGVVAASGPPITAFAQSGAPQFTAFAQEARNLVAALERLTARIERDPARFFLGSQTPNFRR